MTEKESVFVSRFVEDCDGYEAKGPDGGDEVYGPSRTVLKVKLKSLGLRV